jgi:phospholipid transport system substrate-binding protein
MPRPATTSGRTRAAGRSPLHHALCAAAIALLALLARPAATVPSQHPATQSIETLHESLLDVMQHAVELGYEGRADKLAPVIPAHFDVPFMAEKSVGRHWRTASEDERKRFLDVFRRFMIANYAGQFDGFSGQSFETLGQEPARLDTVLVKTRLLNPKDEDVELNYRMRDVDGKWKIIDVYLDGTVSELALRRSEFSGIAKREGMDALIAAIESRIADLAAGKVKR